MTVAFSARERRLIAHLSTPLAVQRYLNQLPQQGPRRATLRSLRGVVARMRPLPEAALPCGARAARYPPLVLSSSRRQTRPIFVYRRAGRWGSVARSRDPGLHGRKPVFATPRALALSYFDPYIDFTGRVTGYAVVDLRVMGTYDWRVADTNVWKVERMLLDHPHRHITSSNQRVNALRAKYRAFRKEFPNKKPLFYKRRERWTEIPG